MLEKVRLNNGKTLKVEPRLKVDLMQNLSCNINYFQCFLKILSNESLIFWLHYQIQPQNDILIKYS